MLSNVAACGATETGRKVCEQLVGVWGEIRVNILELQSERTKKDGRLRHSSEHGVALFSQVGDKIMGSPGGGEGTRLPYHQIRSIL